MRMNAVEISVILYQEDNHWIAQGLEYDITAQSPTLPELRERFAAKVAAEIAISMDLGREPLEGIDPAPRNFWRMFEDAKMTIEAEQPPFAIQGGFAAPRIVSRMKVGQLEVA